MPECTRNLANTITSNPPKPTHFRQTQRFSQATSYWTSCSQQTNNADTQFDVALAGMKALMPSTAGTGTSSSPQNVLIIITDGAEDSSTRLGTLSDATLTQCNAIKNTGALVGILYTEYLANTINNTGHTMFNNFAVSEVPNIEARLRACATQYQDGSYLMQKVSTNGDISEALNRLFAMTVKTARIVR